MSRLLLAVGVVALCVVAAAVGFREWDRSADRRISAVDKPATGHDEPNRRSAVPALPFATNPDPSQCGIPVRWTGHQTARLTGIYHGKLVEPRVFLYDSHLRRRVTASAASGTRVRVVLQQPNPVLDFYLVLVVGDPKRQGWVPAPFLKFSR